MNWDNILKNQITSTKQGVLSSDTPLPKKKKRKDCNQILKEIHEKIDRYFKIEIEGLIKNNYKDIAKYFSTVVSRDITIPKSLEDNPSILVIKSGRSAHVSRLKIKSIEVNISLGSRFITFEDEDNACEVLEFLRNLKINDYIIESRIKQSDLPKNADLVLDGHYMDFQINSGNFYSGKGYSEIYGKIEYHNMYAHKAFFEILKPDMNRILNKVLQIIQDEH